MAINPSIALQGQRPEFADPLSQYAKIAQVRNMLTQGQLHQQQIANEQEQLRTHQLANAETERAQQDSAMFQAAHQEANGDVPKAIELAKAKGVRLPFINKVTDELNKQIEQAAKTSKEKLTAAVETTDFLHERAAATDLIMDPIQQRAKWDADNADAVKVGALPAPLPYPGPEGVHDAAVQLTTLKHVTTAAKAKQEADEAARKEALAPSQKTKAEQEAITATQKAAGTEPMQPKDVATLAREKARDLQIGANEAAMRTQGQQRLGIEGQRLNIEKQRLGFEANGGVSPAAQMAVEGKMDPQTVRAIIRRNPGILNQMKAVDPNFDEANIDNRYATLKEFNSTSNGKAGGQALALNTLIHHADLYLEAADALKNGSFKPGNAIYNRVSELFGSPAPQNASLVARFLAGETGKVATGGVPAEGEIKGILKSLGTDASPDQIAGAGKTLLQIAAGRATPLMERAKQAKIDNVIQVLGPDAKEILKRRGFDPETMKPAGTGGGNKRGAFNPATGKVEYR